MTSPPNEAALAVLKIAPVGTPSDCSPPARVQRIEASEEFGGLEASPTTVRPSGDTPRAIDCGGGECSCRNPIPVKLISPAVAARQSAYDAAQVFNDLREFIIRMRLRFSEIRLAVRTEHQGQARCLRSA